MILRPVTDPAAPPTITIPTSGLVWRLDYGQSLADLESGTLVGSIPNLGSLGGFAAGGSGPDNEKPMFIGGLDNGEGWLRADNFHTYWWLMNSEVDLKFFHTTWVWDLWIVWQNLYVPEATVTGRYSWIFGNTQDAASRGLGLIYRDDGLAVSLNGNLIQHGQIRPSGLICKPGGVDIIRCWGDGSQMRLSLNNGTAVSASLTGTKSTAQCLRPYTLGTFSPAPVSTPGCSHHRHLLVYNAVQADPTAIYEELRQQVDRARMPTHLQMDVGDSRVSGSGSRHSHPAAEQAYYSSKLPGRFIVGNRGVPSQTAGAGSNPLTIPGLVTVANTFIATQYADRITSKKARLRISVNDINAGATAASIIADIQTIKGYFVAAGWEVLIDTVEGFGEYGPWTEDKQEVLETVNAWIRANGGGIDVYEIAQDTVTPTILSHTGLGKENYWAFDADGISDGDGLHWGSKLGKAIAVASLPFATARTLNAAVSDLSFTATDLPEGAEIPPAVAWEPDNAGITGAVLRGLLDPANDFLDTGATSPCVLDGALVAAVDDPTRGIRGVQSDSALRILHRLNVLGGRPMWEWPTGVEYLDLTVAFLSYITGNDKAWTAFFPLLRGETLTTSRTLLGSGLNSAAGNVPVYRASITNNGPAQVKCGDSSPTKTSLGTGNSLLGGFKIAIIENTGTISNMWVYGSDTETPVALGDDLDSLPMNTDNVTLGITKRLTNVLGYLGKMGRVPFYSGVFSNAAHRRNVAQGLQEHYGQ